MTLVPHKDYPLWLSVSTVAEKSGLISPPSPPRLIHLVQVMTDPVAALTRAGEILSALGVTARPIGGIRAVQVQEAVNGPLLEGIEICGVGTVVGLVIIGVTLAPESFDDFGDSDDLEPTASILVPPPYRSSWGPN